MDYATLAKRKFFVGSKSLLTVLIMSCLLLPTCAWGLTLGDNTGLINFSVKPAYGSSADPIFGPSGELLSPGGGYPMLGAAIAPVQTFGPAPIAFPGLVGLADHFLIDTGAFGNGNTAMLAVGSTKGGGIYWTSSFVNDAGPDGLVSANDSQGTATFTNNGPEAFNGYAGVYLAVSGSIFGPGGYAAISLTGTIGGVPFTPIVVASDGDGPLPDFVTAGTNKQYTISGPNYFYAWGQSIIPVPFNIPVGGDIFMQGTVSVIADFAGIYPYNIYGDMAPVPGTLLLLVSGLASLAGLKKKRSQTI